VLVAELVILARPGPDDAAPLVSAVNESRAELAPWMPWAQSPATGRSIGDFLAATRAGWTDFSEFGYVMRDPRTGTVIGVCSLHNRLGPGTLEIGYWVHSSHTGRGVATAAARALTDTALALPGVVRTEIHCDEANVRSAAVPARLGYTLDRITDRQPDTPAASGRFMTWVCHR
jgi:RimJ/RimL family protein N-acetyltransferase